MAALITLVIGLEEEQVLFNKRPMGGPSSLVTDRSAVSKLDLQWQNSMTLIYRQAHGCGLAIPSPLSLQKKLNISVIPKLRFWELTGTGITHFMGNLPVCMNERSRLQVCRTRLKGSVSELCDF